MEAMVNIILAVLSSTTVMSAVLWRTATKRTKEAEAQLAEASAKKAEWERYEKQLDHSATTISTLQAQIQESAERISELNKALNDKTDRIRTLTDKCIESERSINDVNSQLVKVTEERDREKLLKEKYKEWHCQLSDCKDRQPPNPKLKGKKFKSPEVE